MAGSAFTATCLRCAALSSVPALQALCVVNHSPCPAGLQGAGSDQQHEGEALSEVAGRQSVAACLPIGACFGAGTCLSSRLLSVLQLDARKVHSATAGLPGCLAAACTTSCSQLWRNCFKETTAPVSHRVNQPDPNFRAAGIHCTLRSWQCQAGAAGPVQGEDSGEDGEPGCHVPQVSACNALAEPWSSRVSAPAPHRASACCLQAQAGPGHHERERALHGAAAASAFGSSRHTVHCALRVGMAARRTCPRILAGPAEAWLSLQHRSLIEGAPSLRRSAAV